MRAAMWWWTPLRVEAGKRERLMGSGPPARSLSVDGYWAVKGAAVACRKPAGAFSAVGWCQGAGKPSDAVAQGCGQDLKGDF